MSLDRGRATRRGEGGGFDEGESWSWWSWVGIGVGFVEVNADKGLEPMLVFYVLMLLVSSEVVVKGSSEERD